MDAIGSPARPPDKAVAAAVTYGLGFVLRGILLLDRSEEDEHAPDRRPEPEPDHLWQAYEAARAKAAAHLRVTADQAHQRILHQAEVTHGRDPSDPEVQRMIDCAEAMLLTDREPLTPGPDRERAAEKGEQDMPAKAKKDTPAIAATRSAFQKAYKAYQEECREQGLTAKPWKMIASKAIDRAWPDQPGTDEYLKAASACEQEIAAMRGSEEGAA